MQYYKCGITIALYDGMINLFTIYVLLISPNIGLPFEAAIPHCSETVMSALTDLTDPCLHVCLIYCRS